ncbi:meiotic cell cortex C-terminal pleckstrin homology-domain-containing protein [Fennellomyces sp. T-0311]|nr:meiotic cell cortex C-terminal pleckstrin homology-domain-containing protein [Fennellomyces sp. T-0311]
MVQIESLAIAENANASAHERYAIKNEQKHRRQSPELATKIGNNLVVEVRKLRDRIQELETARVSEQQEHDHAVLQRQHMEKHQDQLKDENWELQLAKQELEEQLDAANKKLSRMLAEQARLENQLQQMIDVKTEQVKIEAEANNAARLHEQHRHQLLKELRALKKENANLHEKLQASTTEVSLWKAKLAVATHTKSDAEKSSPADLALPPDPVDDENSNMTPPGSPPFSTKITARMETEEMRHSLAHAHRTIISLRSSLHKEKLERIEAKKLLAESQETVEELRREILLNQSHRKKHVRRFSRQRHRTRAKRHSYYNPSDEEGIPVTADQSNSGDEFGIDQDAMPPSFLFDELKKSTAATSESKETQTSMTEQADKQTQTDFAVLDTVVQYNNDKQPTLVTKGTQTIAIKQGYFEPLKRALHDSSMSIRSRRQEPVMVRSQSIPPRASSVNLMSTVSTPPAFTTAKHQQLHPRTRTSSFGATSLIDRRSKLLECASKNSNTPRPPQISAPPKPAVSISTVTSTRVGKDQVIPCTSRSDTVGTRASSRYSSRGSPILDTLSENVHEPDLVDPYVIDSVTQTMIGNWMWKYTRKYSTIGKSGISQQKGHMRYFWIHPYTRTLYWSTKPPGINHDETKSKRAFIKDIWSVPCGETQCESVPFNLLIRTSARDLMIHAETMQQHHQWIAATCYLLGRPEQIEAEGRFLSSVSTSTITSGNTFSTHNPAFLNSSIIQGSIISSDDDSDDFINIRQCCNGKHDVSTLARR